nr:hypothetical protein [Tanacetum cinerariifolium]
MGTLDAATMLPFYYTPLTAPDAVILRPTLEDLVSTTPSTKLLAKAEASKNDGEESDDDDARIEIPLITPIRSAAKIPVVGNHIEVLFPPLLKTLEEKLLWMMLLTHPPDFFPFSIGPYYATYLKEDIVVGYYKVIHEFSTHREMVQIKALTNDRLAGKMSVLHCFEEFQQRLTSFQGLESQVSGLKKQVTDLNDKVTASDATFVKAKAKGKDQNKKIKLGEGYKHSLAKKDAMILRLKSSLSELASFFRGGFQGLVQKFLASDEFRRVQGELVSLVASVGFKCGLNMDQTQEQLASYFVLGALGRLVEATPLVATTDYPFLNKVADHSTHPLYAIVDLEPDKMAHPAIVLAPMGAGVYPPLLKDASEQNEEWLSAMVDTTNEEMVDAAFDKPVEVFVHDVIHPACEDVN